MSVPWSEKFCPEPGPLETLTVFDKLSSRGQGGAGESEAASPAGLTQGRQWGWTEGSLPREVMKPQLIKQVCRGGEGRLSKSPRPPHFYPGGQMDGGATSLISKGKQVNNLLLRFNWLK